jgi:hypothetical protein
MDFKRLFHILVIGGSVLGCESTRSGALSSSESDDAKVAETDRDTGVADVRADEDIGVEAGATTAPADASLRDIAQAAPCICSATHCCDQHEGGPATVIEGAFCCWGTSC